MTESTSATKAVKTPAAKFGGRGFNVAIVVAAVVTLVGVGLWIFQLNVGMTSTGMRNLSSWGSYITMFMFFVGLSTGSMIVSAAPCALGMEGFGGITKVTAWISICCTVLAVGFVVIDLGHPLRLWTLFAFSNLSSPLMWDILVIGTYLVLSIVYLWAILKAETGKASKTSLRIISFFALMCAVLVCSVDAWIFSLQQARELWNSALLAPWFVVSALVCGIALALISGIALSKAGRFGFDRSSMVKLAKLLGTFVCVDLYFFGCDLLTSAFPQASGLEIAEMLVAGPLAPFFWIEVVGCVVAAVICFAPQLRTAPLVAVASVLALVGVLCKRVLLLVGGFQIPNVDYASTMTSMAAVEWQSGLAGAYEGLVYVPTMTELGVVLGVIGLGALMLLLGLKYLPLRPTEQSH